MLVCGLAASGPSVVRAQQTVDVVALLDRYAHGGYDDVLRDLIAIGDVPAFAKELDRVGPGWIKAAGQDQAPRRQLIAASFALEAAVPHFWPEDVDPLVEWGCQLLRKGGPPTEGEHRWQLASVAIFGRARDDGRLVTRQAPGAPLGVRMPPPNKRVNHVVHARLRFPDEPRFQLADAMYAATAADTEPPRDAEWIPTDRLSKNSDGGIRRARALQAIGLFQALLTVPSLRAESELRTGYLEIVLHEPEKAIEHFARARETDDVFIEYLARFLSGRASDMLDRRDDATAMYRSALELLPGTQSAASALAANLFLAGHPDEAYALADQALSPRVAAGRSLAALWLRGSAPDS